jgi:uncharacterized membrane protein
VSEIMQGDADQATEQERTTLLVCYALHGASIITGLSGIAGVIVNHIKINDTTNEFIRSHHRWLIKTFWITLVVGFVSALLTIILIGFLGLLAIGIWWIYRIVRGALWFSERRPMPDTLI